jgi:hypothetical protein
VNIGRGTTVHPFVMNLGPFTTFPSAWHGRQNAPLLAKHRRDARARRRCPRAALSFATADQRFFVPSCAPVPRYLLIVSRREPGLLKHLQNAFKNDAEVEVVVDRRQRQQRTARPSGGPRPTEERRRVDRRHRPDIDDRVTTLGAALVRIERSRAGR